MEAKVRLWMATAGGAGFVVIVVRTVAGDADIPSAAREEVKSNSPPPIGRRGAAHVIIDRNCCCRHKKFGIGLLPSNPCAGDAAAGDTPEKHAPAERLAREKILPPEHDRSAVEAAVRKASILTGAGGWRK